MSQDCPLVLDPLFVPGSGTSQQDRQLPALGPAYAPVDEHNIADHLVFTQKLSAFLLFINNDNNSDGTTWENFFNKDISTQLSLIVTQQTSDFADTLKKFLLPLQEGTATLAQAKNYYGKIFSALFSLAWQIEKMRDQLPDTLLLKAVVQSLITTRLKDQLKKLLAYYNKAVTDGLINPNANIYTTIFGAATDDADMAAGHSFPAIWNSAITVDPDIYSPATTKIKKLYFAANHNFFKSAIDVFIKAIVKITAAAAQELQETLGQWDSHEPHNALFLAFLKLLQFSRTQLNELTQRHLELYYQEILRLRKKQPVPDKAFMTFTLARFTEEHLLPKGTKLKAGKFPDGSDAYYATDADLAINTATISDMRSVYVCPTEDADPAMSKDRVYASSFPASKDGAGLPFDEPLTPWHPFANKTLADYTKVQRVNMPAAAIGFAFASHYLFLREGNRTITISVATSSPVTNLNAADFTAAVTTAAGWTPVTITGLAAVPTGGFVLTCTMASTLPGTTPFSKAVHKAAYNTNAPVLRVLLSDNTSQTSAWAKLKNTVITGYTLTVSVDKVKNIHVQTDTGVMDPSKPFLPFSAVPVPGAMLLVGCDEIFQKNNARVTPMFMWKQGTEHDFGDSPQLYILRHNDGWKIIRYPLDIFDADIDGMLHNKPREHFYIDDKTQIAPVYSNLNTPYSPASVTGFVRYNLTNDLGYQTSLAQRMNYLTRAANGLSLTGVATGLFTPPTLQEIYLQYVADTQTEAAFFHVYPFGEKQTTIGQHLLPQFLHDTTGNTPSLAEFYLGLQQFTPPRQVTLLFQIDESTANPLVSKPEHQVKWHYLKGDEWIPFNDAAIADGTDNLIRSGIIAFNIPREAGLGHHIMPDQQYWVKATIAEADEAVCKTVSIVTQAVSATFVPGAVPTQTLASPLPAGTIAKLATPQPEIKTVTQPFSSFGGTPQESDTQFYIRCSEQLRHKGRSVSKWDYEHLVLQQFPNLYRAKCIPHTRFENGIYNEMAPGHVTVITIPSLLQRNGIDPLRPFTYMSDLQRVKEYLQKLVSPFVHLHVCNPDYEQVRVEAKVCFFPQYDETLFTHQLREEITRFLAPWAYTEEADLRFENRITNAMIVNFMEKRYYVDYVTDVKLYHAGILKDIITPDRQSAIIVPVKATDHVITPIPATAAATVDNAENCGCA
ncbi:Baseplate J-like protein [Chitinophaga eiseniae]|uniref:Baseplate J-like protein n=1 Tax=Chitinophaga eiseniae TaxID=634771 RepID=A0A1T4T7Y3_9BACT|nr:baseplate J/gp47 family protein [Chitinophaga eiseniae]SKA36546.1 Baseplate J-like protein [Chitinophaga eiseniae]